MSILDEFEKTVKDDKEENAEAVELPIILEKEEAPELQNEVASPKKRVKQGKSKAKKVGVSKAKNSKKTQEEVEVVKDQKFYLDKAKKELTQEEIIRRRRTGRL